MLEWEGLNGQIRPLIEDPQGILRNPDVSFDGRRVLFAWKKSNFGDDFHLYEIEVDGGAIRQLTSGRALPITKACTCPTATSCSVPRAVVRRSIAIGST